MDQLVATYTALPNLHPAVVHFPIALLPLGVLFDLVSLGLRRAPFWDRLAATFYALGAAGAAVAVWAGERAADSLVDAPLSVQPAIGEHNDAGHLVLYLFAAVAAARLYLCWRDRRADRLGRVAVRTAVAPVALYGLWLLFSAADQGGALVYEHGLGVAKRPVPPASRPEPEPAEAGGAAASRLVERADGGLAWRPLAGDGAALGDLLEPLSGGSSRAAAGAVAAAGAEAAGLTLELSGLNLLLLEPAFGDVQIEAELDLAGFDGRVGLAHHVRGLDDRAHFAVTADGFAELIDIRGGEVRSLARDQAERSYERVRLAVSSAGRHLRGLVDGTMVVHGHVAAPPPGRVGLLADGSGVVRVISLEVTPLAGAD